MKLGYKKNIDEMSLDGTDSNLIISDNLDLEIYDDITSIENWYYHHNHNGICTDYLQMRDRVRDVLNEKKWSGCTVPEKDIIIELYTKETDKSNSTSNTEKIIHLIYNKGMSQADAIAFLQYSFANFHIKEIESSLKRAQSVQLFKIIAKYLSISDAADFTRTITTPYHLYTTQGIRGINDGEAGEGLFDFIESTVGSSYETTGLNQQGYIMANGDSDATNFIIELMDVLRKGNY